MDWEDVSRIKAKCGRFRVLVIGKANAGKTTILQKVCNATEKPVIFNPRGDKISAEIVQSSKGRGKHEIDKELVFASHPGFIFHDSRGFEAGSKAELNHVKKFIVARLKEPNLADRLHAVWFCIPTDTPRILLEDETSFFEACDPGNVPVIAIFTKFDFRHQESYRKLMEGGASRAAAKKLALNQSREDFERTYAPRLYDRRYPPRAHIFLHDMHEPNASCDDLIKATAEALDDNALRWLFVSMQQNCIDLCVEYAIRHILSHEKRRRSTFGLNLEEMKDIVYNCLIWFPSNLSELEKWTIKKKQSKDDQSWEKWTHPWEHWFKEHKTKHFWSPWASTMLLNESTLEKMRGPLKQPLIDSVARFAVAMTMFLAYWCTQRNEDIRTKIRRTVTVYLQSEAFDALNGRISDVLQQYHQAPQQFDLASCLVQVALDRGLRDGLREASGSKK